MHDDIYSFHKGQQQKILNPQQNKIRRGNEQGFHFG